MRLAVISDLHGNLEAFREVLDDMDRVGVDDCVCLGDIVGYGPEPEAVVRLIQERDIPSVMGNHELALADKRYLSWFNHLAQKTVFLTEAVLSAPSLAFCRELPQFLDLHDILFVHGCPPDSALTYMFEPSDRELAEIMRSMKHPLCFVGHTHLLELYTEDRGVIRRQPLECGRIVLPSAHRHIVNAGAVGQPRDGNNAAKYVIWDDVSRELEVRYVPYNIDVTAERILAMGWPEFLATRLY